MQTVQAFVQRTFNKLDRDHNGFIGMMPDASGKVEGANYKNKSEGRVFDFLRAADVYPMDSWVSIQELHNAVASKIDTNNDGKIGVFERIKAFFKFGL